MTPGLPTSPCSECSFWIFPNEALSFFLLLPVCCVSTSVCVCVCVCFNHHIALPPCKHNIYPRAWRPETPVAYEVVMATEGCTQACFHAAGTRAALQNLKGECWEKGKWRGPGWDGGGGGWRGANWGLIVLNQLSWLRARTRLFSISFVFFPEFLPQ